MKTKHIETERIERDGKSERTRNGRTRPEYQLITLAFERLLIEERKKDTTWQSDWQREDVRKVGKIYVDVPVNERTTS